MSLATVFGLIGATAVADGAQDRKQVIGTKVKVDGRPYFSGKVTSDRYACRARRKVRVFRKTNSGDELLGKDRSNRRGRFSVPTDISTEDPNEPWVVYAKVRRLEKSRFMCRRAVSKFFVLD